MTFIRVLTVGLVPMVLAACDSPSLKTSLAGRSLAPGLSLAANGRSVCATIVERSLAFELADARETVKADRQKKIRRSRRDIMKTGARKLSLELDPIRCAKATSSLERLFGSTCVARAKLCGRLR